MNPKERQKMCPSCDGRVPLEADACALCGASFGIKSRMEEDHMSLYTPPYSGKNEEPTTKSGFKRPDSFKDAASLLNNPSIGGINPPPVEEKVEETRGGFWPMFLLSVGGNLLSLGLLQLFFGEEGVLRLEWNSGFWYLYCLGSLPLLFLGYKKLA